MGNRGCDIVGDTLDADIVKVVVISNLTAAIVEVEATLLFEAEAEAAMVMLVTTKTAMIILKVVALMIHLGRVYVSQILATTDNVAVENVERKLTMMRRCVVDWAEGVKE